MVFYGVQTNTHFFVLVIFSVEKSRDKKRRSILFRKTINISPKDKKKKKILNLVLIHKHTQNIKEILVLKKRTKELSL